MFPSLLFITTIACIHSSFLSSATTSSTIIVYKKLRNKNYLCTYSNKFTSKTEAIDNTTIQKNIFIIIVFAFFSSTHISFNISNIGIKIKK